MVIVEVNQDKLFRELMRIARSTGSGFPYTYAVGVGGLNPNTIQRALAGETVSTETAIRFAVLFGYSKLHFIEVRGANHNVKYNEGKLEEVPALS